MSVGNLVGRPRSQPPDTGAPSYRVGAGALDPRQLWRALPEALRRLNPVTPVRNPVMWTRSRTVCGRGGAAAGPNGVAAPRG